MIRGTKLPNFFIFFGGIFGGIPCLMLFLFLFGEGSGDSWIIVPFVSLFVLVGGAIFLLGLFQMLGKTEVRINTQQVAVRRILFGWSHVVEIPRDQSFSATIAESHKTNDVPQYAVMFSGLVGAKTKTTKVGGSLKDAALTALYRELCVLLDQKLPPEHASPAEVALEVYGNSQAGEWQLEPWQGQTMRISLSGSQWLCELKGSSEKVLFFLGLLFALGGSFFFPATRQIYDSVFGDMLNGAPTIPDNLGSIFPFSFMSLGVGLVLFWLIIRNHHCLIEAGNGRLTLTKKIGPWGRSTTFSQNELVDVRRSTSGAVNDIPRYKVDLIHHGGKTGVCYFRDAEESGRIVGFLREFLPEQENGNSYAGSIPAEGPEGT